MLQLLDFQLPAASKLALYFSYKKKRVLWQELLKDIFFMITFWWSGKKNYIPIVLISESVEFISLVNISFFIYSSLFLSSPALSFPHTLSLLLLLFFACCH